MKLRSLVVTLLLSACPAPASYPLQICETYEESCTAGFECVGFRCIADCRYEGDCDPGFRCVDDQCLQSCEGPNDCTIGVCAEIGDGRAGNACRLQNLPGCATDDHCGWGLCVDGGCLGRCDWVGECGFDQVCDFRRGDYGTCVPDPNYIPPPPVTACFEAPFPDQWCQVQTGLANTYCDGNACVTQYPAALVLDESGPENCSDDDASPGTDLMGIRILTGSGTYLSLFEFGFGAGNTHTDASLLETVNAASCELDDQWLSLGCGGGVVVIPGNVPIRPQTEIEVYTNASWCTDASFDTASVYLCNGYPLDLNTARQICDVYLGSVSETVLRVP